MIPRKPNLMVGGILGPVVVEGEVGYDLAERNLLLRVEVGHSVHDEKTEPYLYFEPLVAQALEVGATTDQSF